MALEDQEAESVHKQQSCSKENSEATCKDKSQTGEKRGKTKQRKAGPAPQKHKRSDNQREKDKASRPSETQRTRAEKVADNMQKCMMLTC